MIQLRKNPFSENQIEIPFKQGETAKELIDRTLSENGFVLSENILAHYQIAINGHIIDRDMWPLCAIKEEDTILIGPRIARGSGGQLFKTIAIIVVTVAAAVFAGDFTGSTSAAVNALFTAAVSIGSTLALNALIPPPGLPGLGGLGGNSSSFEGSQMYTITSQANNAKKFGSVPKVYGTHRVFPIIAANPYTDIEADPSSGTLVQYFYAIYDFGYGPLDIYDIKIGETEISEYADANWRLVDLNKPATDEGEWDENLHETFTLYKGDVERDGTQVVIDKNQGQSGATVDDYQVVRTASSKVNDADQEIILDFVCPQGLNAFAATGKQYDRSIDLLVEFSEVGEDDWKPFNDLTYVYDFEVAGGDSIFKTKATELHSIDPISGGEGYDTLSVSNEVFARAGNYFLGTNPRADKDIVGDLDPYGYSDHDNNIATLPIKLVKSELRKFGFAKGRDKILLKDVEGVSIANGDSLYFAGNLLGVVVSTSASLTAGYTYYHLDAPLSKTYTVFTSRARYVESRDNNGGKNPIYATYLYDARWLSSASLTDKITFKVRTLGVARITANTQNPYYSTIKFKPRDRVQYKVRVTRTGSNSSFSYRTSDKLSLVNLATRFDRKPILTDKRHVFLEVRIRATNQLNGAIQNLSAIAESVLDVYDSNTQTWSKQKTNNPAWIFCDLMTGEINKRAISKSRLYMPSIVEWADFCDEIPTPPPTQSFTLPRFTANFVLDFDTTLQSLLNTLCNSAQASLNIIDGKYGVLIDKLKTTPVQIFTPRNSTGFSSQRTYDESPHALKIRYIDPVKNWDIAEITVYDQGYDEETATTFDELSTFACTNYEQAWRFGRYMLAQARLRKERITINVDFEHLVCTRGDYVQVTQDVMRVGGRPARVKAIIDADEVEIDDAIETVDGVDYGYVYRGVNGIESGACDVLTSTTLKLYSDMPSVGDLIIVGEVGKVVYDCIVKSISPSSDLSATLELVEKADDIYLAESSDTLPIYNPQLALNTDSANTAPAIVENLAIVTNTWRVVGRSYEHYIDIDWDLPTGSAVDIFEIYVDSGKGYTLIELTSKTEYQYIVDKANLDILHRFKILAVSASGKKIQLFDAPQVTATPESKVTPPSDITDLYINITNEILELAWPAITDTDLAEYLIRFSPRVSDASWDNSIPLLKADKNTNSTATQARTGTYFIKAIDLNGNESLTSAQARTTIPNLFDLNVIEQTSDFPDLLGEKDTVESDGNGLILQKEVDDGVDNTQFYSVGYYNYTGLLDMGEIYTVRLQSYIEAEGFRLADVMSNWETLEDLDLMSQVSNSDWDVEAQWRGTDSLNPISEWTQLSLIETMGEGNEDNWTPWRKFTVSDVTARVLQFRLKLVSYKADTTPKVFDCVIKSDMPDRTEIYNNIVAPITGYELEYEPAFKGPGTSPNIQITIDGAEAGDYFEIEDKTLNGFKITFYDINNVAVERQFDAFVKGYGRKSTVVI